MLFHVQNIWKIYVTYRNVLSHPSHQAGMEYTHIPLITQFQINKNRVVQLSLFVNVSCKLLYIYHYLIHDMASNNMLKYLKYNI